MRPVYTNTDRELILMVSVGNEDAFRKFFDRYRNKIFSIACKIIGLQSAAEDVVQEVFIKLWLKKESLPEVENFNAYLNMMVRNHIFNYLRKVAYQEGFLQKLTSKPIQKYNDGFDSVCYHELEGLVHKAVDQLPPQQKIVYNFSRVDGLKHEVIAEKMGISRSTVKGHMVEALSHIKNFLLSKEELVIFLILMHVYSTFLSFQ